MKNKILAFVDIETTGTNFMKHEIIEIGCVLARQLEGGRLEMVEEFELKIKPERIEDADIEALRVNSYHEADWIFAYSAKEALSVLAKKAEGAVMVAHNVTFDYTFLAKAFKDSGIDDPFFYAKLDTIPMAFAKLRNEEDSKRFSLHALCEYFGIANSKAHTALADARATFEVFQKLMAL